VTTDCLSTAGGPSIQQSPTQSRSLVLGQVEPAEQCVKLAVQAGALIVGQFVQQRSLVNIR
jgi:hypothetical protein